jgi:hypothetical protein
MNIMPGHTLTTGHKVANHHRCAASRSGYLNATGEENTFIGLEAGYSNYSGNYNSFLGWDAGYFNIGGSENTFLGYTAGFSNTMGNKNTYLGLGAGFYGTTGNFNTFLGHSAGHGNTTGYSDLFVGLEAGFKNTTGWANTYVGQQAGHENTTGIGNTLLGSGAGFNNATGGLNVFVGNGAGYTEMGSSKLYVDNCRELKNDIAKLSGEEASQALAALDPVKFNYKGDARWRHVGFIAEDVPELLASPDRKGLSPMDIVAVLTKVVQEQRDTIALQQQKLERLEARLARMEHRD